jgi:hypothetical protein|nr:MAG TPA: hypothetical protein [Herelleviridae sp.]
MNTKRSPSIHITKPQFEEILNTLEVNNFPVEAFFVIARKMAINHRTVLVSNNKNTKRVNNILLASKGDAALVADILYATRIKLKHRGVRKINESNSREWANCKKLAEVCNTFCEDFKLDTREGFIKYIETGLKRMTDYRNVMQRLISMQDNITNQIDAEIELKEDKDPGFTKDIHDEFIKRVASVTGIYESYEHQPEKYVHFLRIHNLMDEKGWNVFQFLDAQFEALAWCKGLPEPSQMYNDKAIERYNKYLYKNKDKRTLDEPQVEGSLWDKIRK